MAQTAPSRNKFETRNPKLETNSNVQKAEASKRLVSDFEFRFYDFKFVSDFDIRISDLLRWLLGAINFPNLV
jgi:hypothetical protein